VAVNTGTDAYRAIAELDLDLAAGLLALHLTAHVAMGGVLDPHRRLLLDPEVGTLIVGQVPAVSVSTTDTKPETNSTNLS
jgi:hypothetical protein